MDTVKNDLRTTPNVGIINASSLKMNYLSFLNLLFFIVFYILICVYLYKPNTEIISYIMLFIMQLLLLLYTCNIANQKFRQDKSNFILWLLVSIGIAINFVSSGMFAYAISNLINEFNSKQNTKFNFFTEYFKNIVELYKSCATFTSFLTLLLILILLLCGDNCSNNIIKQIIIVALILLLGLSAYELYLSLKILPLALKKLV